MVTAQARIRAKHQLTLPDAVVRAGGIVEGDRFVVEIAPDEPDVIRLRRLPTSFAGALADVFADGSAYLEEERAAWDRS